MVKYCVPWDSNKNIYRAYLSEVESSDKDWICFIDADAGFQTSDFGLIIEKAIKQNQDYDLLTCYTNRVCCPWQIAPYVDRKTNDISYHRTLAEFYRTINHTDVERVVDERPLSGMVFMVKKDSFLKAMEGENPEGMLGVDNLIHEKFMEKGYKIGLLKGIYVYHWYSNFSGEGKRNVKHLV